MRVMFAASVMIIIGATAAAGAEMPAAQARFIEINDAIARAFVSSDNPTVSSMISVLSKRSQALCQVAPQGAVANWLAVVSAVELDSNLIELAFGPAASVTIVDLPIDPSDFRAADIAGLTVGLQVSVSGKFIIEDGSCFRQLGPLTKEALTRPVFEFEIGAIRALGF